MHATAGGLTVIGKSRDALSRRDASRAQATDSNETTRHATATVV